MPPPPPGSDARATGYRIEARALPVVAGLACHNFWVLRDAAGISLAELHGLATERATGKPVPIGTDAKRHALRAWQFIHQPPYHPAAGTPTMRTLIRAGQPAKVVAQGAPAQIFPRWDAAVAAIAEINARDLDYPAFGLRLAGGTINSNSIYRTFGELMGLQVYIFRGRLQPGVAARVLPTARIAALGHHGRRGSR